MATRKHILRKKASEQAALRDSGSGVRPLDNSVLGNRLTGHLLVQRKARDAEPGGTAEQEADRPAGGSGLGTLPNAAQRAATDALSATPSLIAEDDAEHLQPGQMRRSDFLAEVRAQVCSTADEALQASGQTAQGCPWIEYWLSYYGGQDAAHIERALYKFAPHAPRAGSAREYIPIISARVRQGVDRYTRTGETPDLPDGLMGGGLLGSLGSIFFKTRDGGARAAEADPEQVRQQLGAGRPLESGVRSKMESAFGTGFSHVRVHTEGHAASLSDEFDARAFAVGEHVAFSPGEYRPDSPVGQALIAHELAHVVQQSGAAGRATQSQGPHRSAHSGAPLSDLETDADHTAVRAMVSILGGTGRGMASVSQQAVPRLKSGLRLSRCGPKAQATPVKSPTGSGPVKDGATAQPDAATPTSMKEPPAPEKSFWFEDPKDQIENASGDQQMDFSKAGKGPSGPQRLSGIIRVLPESKFSRVGDMVVRFAFPESGLSPQERAKARDAVLDALKSVVSDVEGHELGETNYEWSSPQEKVTKEREIKQQQKRMSEERARLKEALKGYTQDNPLNIYLAPATPKEFAAQKTTPITAQVYVNLKDVGDAAKLKTAIRLPLMQVSGGVTASAVSATDLQATLLHESVHAMLLNRHADYGTVWNEIQSKMSIEGPDKVKTRTLGMIRAYILAQEELFAYTNEEIIYPTGRKDSTPNARPAYELFLKGMNMFFSRKKAAMSHVSKSLDVEEKVDKKKVKWEIKYDFPQALKLEEKDLANIEVVEIAWPMKDR